MVLEILNSIMFLTICLVLLTGQYVFIFLCHQFDRKIFGLVRFMNTGTLLAHVSSIRYCPSIKFDIRLVDWTIPNLNALLLTLSYNNKISDVHLHIRKHTRTSHGLWCWFNIIVWGICKYYLFQIQCLNRIV